MAFAPDRGLMLIPDISGYTEFIHSVEINHGGHIVSSLLEALIEENSLGLTLSEVEGDALLFFRMGEAPDLDAIREQVDRWFVAFHTRLNLLKRDSFCTCGACNYIGRMSLKIVGHYGQIGSQRIGTHTKLIGKDVVLTHRMLKNTVGLDEYLFITEDLCDAAGGPPAGQDGVVTRLEEYPVFGKVETRCFDLSALHEQVPPAPDRAELPAAHIVLREELEINCSLEGAARFLSNPENQLKWIPGMKTLEMNRTEPMRAGHRHVCVMEGRNIHQQLDRIVKNEDEFKLVLRVKPPRLMLKSWHTLKEVSRTGKGVRVALSFALVRQPVLGLLFGLLMQGSLSRMLRRSLENLKTQLELEVPAADVPKRQLSNVGGLSSRKPAMEARTA